MSVRFASIFNFIVNYLDLQVPPIPAQSPVHSGSNAALWSPQYTPASISQLKLDAQAVRTIFAHFGQIPPRPFEWELPSRHSCHPHPFLQARTIVWCETTC